MRSAVVLRRVLSPPLFQQLPGTRRLAAGPDARRTGFRTGDATPRPRRSNAPVVRPKQGGAVLRRGPVGKDLLGPPARKWKAEPSSDGAAELAEALWAKVADQTDLFNP